MSGLVEFAKSTGVDNRAKAGIAVSAVSGIGAVGAANSALEQRAKGISSAKDARRSYELARTERQIARRYLPLHLRASNLHNRAYRRAERAVGAYQRVLEPEIRNHDKIAYQAQKYGLETPAEQKAYRSARRESERLRSLKPEGWDREFARTSPVARKLEAKFRVADDAARNHRFAARSSAIDARKAFKGARYTGRVAAKRGLVAVAAGGYAAARTLHNRKLSD